MLGRSSNRGQEARKNSPTTPSERIYAAARAAHALMGSEEAMIRYAEAAADPLSNIVPPNCRKPRGNILQEQAPAYGHTENTEVYDMTREDSVEEVQGRNKFSAEMKGIPIPEVHLKRTDHPVENAAAQRYTEQLALSPNHDCSHEVEKTLKVTSATGRQAALIYF